MIEESQLAESDGHLAPEVGAWASTKHRKIAYYSRLFATSMKGKWQSRIYLDLFAGAGKATIKDTPTIIPGTPLLALNHPDPFDLNIFCDSDVNCITALKARTQHYFPDSKCGFVHGNCNDSIDDILRLFPRFNKAFKGLTLCLVDPFGATDINFSTLELLSSSLYLDFLVLIPTYMDFHRNLIIYTKPDSQVVDNYLGTDSWRSDWKDSRQYPNDFGIFVAEQFCLRMKSIGFLYEGLDDLELVRMDTGKNLPLYHLAFFSKSKLGLKFWRDTRRNTTSQLSLF